MAFILRSSVAGPARWLDRRRLRPDGITLAIIGIAVLGVVNVLAREATYGPRLDWDSIYYVAVARNLLAGEGFTNFDGAPLMHWPPIYPLLLALASLGLFDPLDVAGLLNAIIFGLTILVVGCYLRNLLESGFLVILSCSALALSVPLADLSSWVLSESAFILLTILALVSADKFLAEGRNGFLIWSAALSALAWLCRYIGLAVPVALGLLLLLCRSSSLFIRVKRIAIFSAIAGTPMGLWILRNHLATGQGPGRIRQARSMAVDTSLPEILKDAQVITSGWWHFDLLAIWWPQGFPQANGMAFALFIIPAIMLMLCCYIFMQDYLRGIARAHWRSFCVFGIFALAYFITLVIAMLGIAWDGLVPRYMTPIYVPVLVVMAVSADRVMSYGKEYKLLGSLGDLPLLKSVLRRTRAKSASLMSVVLLGIGTLFVAGQIVPNIVEIRKANSRTGGFAPSPWFGSDTVKWIRSNPLLGPVYSNEARIVYLNNAGDGPYVDLSTLRPENDIAYDSEGIYAYEISDQAIGREALAAWLETARDGAWKVWFHTSFRIDQYSYGIGDMSITPGLEPVAHLSDGSIFRVNRGFVPSDSPLLVKLDSILLGEAGEPAASSSFDIWFDNGTLTMFKNACVADDIRGWFFWEVYPSDPADLPALFSEHGFEFEGYSFTFPANGIGVDGNCIAMVDLRDYEASRIVIGKRGAWQTELHPQR